MKVILLLFAASGFLGLLTCVVEEKSAASEAPSVRAGEVRKDDRAKSEKPLVLVELFTSEGCSSCPPADRVLAQLEKTQPNADAEIVTLSMHVDYWNNIGWKDPFSSALYSQRQAIYGQKFKINSIYTPQMIVDGAKQFVGGSMDEAGKAVSESAKSPKAKIELEKTANRLKIAVADIPAHADATVYLAIAEDNLKTKVGGENGGRTLEHSSVVRQLIPLGRILATDAKFEKDLIPQLEPDWKKDDLKIIVFLQENKSRKIIGIAKMLWTRENY